MALRTSDQALRLAGSYARIAAAMRSRNDVAFQQFARIYDLAYEIALMKTKVLTRNEGGHAN
jgi:hypothetical protein